MNLLTRTEKTHPLFCFAAYILLTPGLFLGQHEAEADTEERGRRHSRVTMNHTTEDRVVIVAAATNYMSCLWCRASRISLEFTAIIIIRVTAPLKRIAGHGGEDGTETVGDGDVVQYMYRRVVVLSASYKLS